MSNNVDCDDSSSRYTTGNIHESDGNVIAVASASVTDTAVGGQQQPDQGTCFEEEYLSSECPMNTDRLVDVNFAAVGASEKPSAAQGGDHAASEATTDTTEEKTSAPANKPFGYKPFNVCDIANPPASSTSAESRASSPASVQPRSWTYPVSSPCVPLEVPPGPSYIPHRALNSQVIAPFHAFQNFGPVFGHVPDPARPGLSAAPFLVPSKLGVRKPNPRLLHITVPPRAGYTSAPTLMPVSTLAPRRRPKAVIPVPGITPASVPARPDFSFAPSPVPGSVPASFNGSNPATGTSMVNPKDSSTLITNNHSTPTVEDDNEPLVEDDPLPRHLNPYGIYAPLMAAKRLRLQSALPVNEYSPRSIGGIRDQTKAKRSCQCTTRCLQLYCDCFASGMTCADQCLCARTCMNSAASEPQRHQAVLDMISREKDAFRGFQPQPKCGKVRLMMYIILCTVKNVCYVFWSVDAVWNNELLLTMAVPFPPTLA
jgi:hypothetical protein